VSLLKLLAICPGIAIVLSATLAVAQSRSPADFDLACAIVTGAEMGASQNEQNVQRRDMALTLLAFYIGRLSGRDDSKDWNAIARGRVAELQQGARSSKLFDACLDLYISKIQ
jgi:hypothetical protein